MKRCTKCGKEMQDEAIFCPNCGSRTSAPATDKKESDCFAPQTKYCSTCGAELRAEAVVCTACGCAQNNSQPSANVKREKSGLRTAAKIFMIISCVFQIFLFLIIAFAACASGYSEAFAVGFVYLIPIAWCLPMTITYSNKCKNSEPVGAGFKVCTLLFVNLIAGILMLCDNSNNNN